MLSERGLQIVDKLIENNRIPITSKTLAIYLGVSERSVKTYIKEVSDFCNEHSMILERKPGIGFVADFTDQQIKQVADLKRDKKIVMSKEQRMSYIMYILLSGWDTYTLSLFSEELNVSKKVISDDINSIFKEFSKYNIRINRVAGHGVFITGDEFSIRRAMKSYCKYSIGNKVIREASDNRISVEDQELWINNFGQDNFEKSVEVIHYIEETYGIAYTDYSFKMLADYLCIQLFRVRMGNVITEDIIPEDENIKYSDIVDKVVEKFSSLSKCNLNEYEKQYIEILLASASVQSNTDLYKAISSDKEEKAKKISGEMLEYLSEILNIDLTSNELLKISMENFVPSSLIRTRYGIEATNPFLGDIREMYSGIFAICFTLTRFYEKYCGAIPTDHEISFLALFVGGALHRNVKTIRAVILGTSGIAASTIVARKIESRIEEIKIVAILSSELMDTIDQYDCDIVLSTISSFEYEDKVVHISPIISAEDEKNIKSKCFEIISHPELQKQGFYSLIDIDNILFVNEKLDKEKILKEACKRLYNGGYVNKDFFDDVMKREKIEPTAIGNGVAIPHGTPDNVIKPKVFVVRLAHPINWGGKMVDTIFVLAINFDNIGSTKAFFHDFARLLGSGDKIARIRKSSDIREMEKILKEELSWE